MRRKTGSRNDEPIGTIGGAIVAILSVWYVGHVLAPRLVDDYEARIQGQQRIILQEAAARTHPSLR